MSDEKYGYYLALALLALGHLWAMRAPLLGLLVGLAGLGLVAWTYHKNH